MPRYAHASPSGLSPETELRRNRPMRRTAGFFRSTNGGAATLTSRSGVCSTHSSLFDCHRRSETMTFALNDYPDDRAANSNTYSAAHDSASSIPGILDVVLQDIPGR